MSAKVDVEGNHSRPLPTVGGSVYLKPQDIPWSRTTLDKVSIKVLYENRERGESTILIKLEPGALIPFHEHPEIEQALVLEGSIYDHDGVCGAGEYVWRKPHSFHENRSDEGAVVFAVYRKQNVFMNNEGEIQRVRSHAERIDEGLG